MHAYYNLTPFRPTYRATLSSNTYFMCTIIILNKVMGTIFFQKYTVSLLLFNDTSTEYSTCQHVNSSFIQFILQHNKITITSNRFRCLRNNCIINHPQVRSENLGENTSYVM